MQTGRYDRKAMKYPPPPLSSARPTLRSDHPAHTHVDLYTDARAHPQIPPLATASRRAIRQACCLAGPVQKGGDADRPSK